MNIVLGSVGDGSITGIGSARDSTERIWLRDVGSGLG